MEDLLNYSLRLEEAGLRVVRGVLEEVVRTGLPGEHHFYLSFDPTVPGVEMAASLRQTYPEEMTIVLQHQYEDLQVDETGFSVVLAFSGVFHQLVVPWSALRRFVDPAASFGLQFSGVTTPAPIEPVVDTAEDEVARDDAESGAATSAAVLQFDEFRKR